LSPANEIEALTWGTYTITPASLGWLREEMLEPLEAPQTAANPTRGSRARWMTRALLQALSGFLGGGRCSGPSG
jgi:hypothetical protein